MKRRTLLAAAVAGTLSAAMPSFGRKIITFMGWDAAKAIHANSPRSRYPFVVISCGSIPRELLESELFGHIKGSFTGAYTHKKGKVELALPNMS